MHVKGWDIRSTGLRGRRTLPDRVETRDEDGPQVRALPVTCTKETDARLRQQATGIREGKGICSE